MKFGPIETGPGFDKAIRFAYVGVIVMLAIFGQQTYAELKRQRSAPVILPNYAFYVLNDPETASAVHAIGTWYVTDGPAPLDTLQTTTIECAKAKMQCVESTAKVSVQEKGFLDATSTVFEVERWTSDEIVTKPERGQCTTRIVSLDLVNRRVSSVIAAIPYAASCKEQPHTLSLDSGVKARSEAANKAN